MDFNGLPLGMGMGLAMNAKAMEGYAKMSEAEKEDMILKCRDAKSKSEMQRIIDSVAGDEEKDGGTLPDDLFQGPGIG